MKRKFTFLIAAAVMLLTMMATTGRMWGQSTAVLPNTQALTTSFANVGSDSNIKIKTSSANTYTNPLRFYANVTTTIQAQSGYKILSITYEASSTGNYVTNAQEATVTPSVTPTVSGKNVTWNYSSATTDVTEFTFKPAAQTRCNSITITYTTSGGGSTPSISANDVNIAYNATQGSIACTINNGVEGGELTASVPANSWITLGEVTDDAVPFTCAANSEHNARTETVTLTYSYNTNETVTKDVTITQAAAPVAYTTIPALFDAATTTETDVLVTFDNWVVSGVATNGKNVFVTDNNGNGFVIYSSTDMSETYAAGNILSGTVSCKLKLYNGFAELLNVDADDLTITEGGTVTVAEVAMADLTGVNTGALLHYDNLTCSITNNKYYLSDGTTSIQVYNALYAFDALEDGKNYNITGVYQQYNSTKEILPRSANDIEEVVSTEPTIAVSPATVNAPFVGTDGTLTVTYENIPDLVAFYIQFCDANGDELQGDDPDWIDAEIQKENDVYSVYYVINANDGEARSAYFKVYTFIGTNLDAVYSNLVTINQAEYVAPSYAELPFSFNGGRDDIENTDGLSQEGLGSDYNASTSPNTKLKFDTTNDWLLLQFEERPGTLTFSIKNNSFSEGTFKVQTSVDGTTFEDLKIYTDEVLIGTLNEEFTELNENIRYIKWIYTDRQSGNVGLGNIALAKYIAPVASITVDPDLIEAPATPVAPATAITGSLTVTLSNITITELDQLGVDFCDENGSLLTGTNTKPSWFEYEFELVNEEYKLNYTIAANTETTVRVAYFKVYEINSEVYSNKVTVTQEAYVAPTATITLDGYAINAPAAETEGNLAITLENIVITETGGGEFDMVFCDNQGTPLPDQSAKPEWFGFDFPYENDAWSVYYIIGENTTTEERTAYFKVYGLGDDGNTEAYSELVTVTQAGATGPVTTGTIAFGSAEGSTAITTASLNGQSVTDNMGNTWTITTVFGAAGQSFTQNAAYSQVGASSKPATSITFTTTLAQQKTISAFEAKFGGFNGTVGDIALTVGNTTVGSGSLNGSTDVTVDATTTTEVGTVLTVTVTNIDKGVKCYYISYTLSDAPVVPVINPTANPIAYNATTGSIDYTIDNYEAGTMTAASEADWISNIDVEEADEMGEVTFNVTANESSASRSATVTLTLTYGDPAATVTKDVTVTQNGQPSITVSPATANVAFAGGTPEFAVTYESLEITGADDFDVEFYETAASTTAGDQPEWITNAAITSNTTDGFTLTVTVAANDGDAREAYLKLSAAGNSDFIYSNLVTISQAAYSQLATYTIVTSIDDLTPGYHYYVAGLNGENWFAMGGQNNNNRSAIAVNVTNNKISETANVCEFVISVDNNGLYTIYDELVTEKTPGYLYAPSGNSNYLKTQTTNTNNGIWTISINNETHVATIKANISSDKYMRYNSGSTIFSCYSSNTSQKDIYLFKKDNDVNIAYYGVEITYTEPNIPVGETITVGNGSVMTVPAAFTNTDPTSLIIEDGGQLVVSNPVAATMDKTYTKPSSWGNNSKGVNGWYLISSPVGTVNTSAVANLTPANSYDLYAYNEPDMMWYNAQGADHPFSQLVEGEGYLYSSKDGADAAYSGTVFCGSLTKTLSYEAANAEMKGWNLLGNPYSHNITWANLTPTAVNESGYYTLGFDGSWSAEPSTTAVIKPMQGFLVQATSTGAKVVFNNIAASAKARSNNDFIAFTVANGQYEDVTYAMFEEGLGLNKINHRNSDIPMVYIPQNGQNYAIATMSDETQSFNLNFKAMTTGKYTLSYKAEGSYDYLHVIDRITGEDVDMLLDGEYSFMASAGDNDARFIVKLRYDANGNFDSDIFAYQNGDEIIVNGEGELQIFDVMGRFVTSMEVNGSERINAEQYSNAVYIFRLVGNDVKTQKIVVR